MRAEQRYAVLWVCITKPEFSWLMSVMQVLQPLVYSCFFDGSLKCDLKLQIITESSVISKVC